MRRLIVRLLRGSEDREFRSCDRIDWAQMSAAFPIQTALTQSGALVLREGGHWRSPKRYETARFCREFLLSTNQSHLWEGQRTVEQFELWLAAGSEPATGTIKI